MVNSGLATLGAFGDEASTCSNSEDVWCRKWLYSHMFMSRTSRESTVINQGVGRKRDHFNYINRNCKALAWLSTTFPHCPLTPLHHYRLKDAYVNLCSCKYVCTLALDQWAHLHLQRNLPYPPPPLELPTPYTCCRDRGPVCFCWFISHVSGRGDITTMDAVFF